MLLNWFMRNMTASSTMPPTFSKWPSMPFGQATFKALDKDR